MNYTIHRFEIIDSTNSAASRLVGDGAPEGTVVVAAEQTAGRGRMSRRWLSPPGSGLYLSLILRPGKPLAELWQLAFVTSLAAAESLSDISKLPIRIKWPNDLLLNGRKLAGILIETRKASECRTCRMWNAERGVQNVPNAYPGQAVGCAFEHAVIVGIGVNVNTPSFPPDIAGKATSLLLEMGAASIDISAVEAALLDSFAIRYDQYMIEGFAPILEAWRAFDCTRGLHISVATSEGTINGVANGVDASGDLILSREDGSEVRLASGEVILGETRDQ